MKRGGKVSQLGAESTLKTIIIGTGRQTAPPLSGRDELADFCGQLMKIDGIQTIFAARVTVHGKHHRSCAWSGGTA